MNCHSHLVLGSQMESVVTVSACVDTALMSQLASYSCNAPQTGRLSSNLTEFMNSNGLYDTGSILHAQNRRMKHHSYEIGWYISSLGYINAMYVLLLVLDGLDKLIKVLYRRVSHIHKHIHYHAIRFHLFSLPFGFIFIYGTTICVG